MTSSRQTLWGKMPGALAVDSLSKFRYKFSERTPGCKAVEHSWQNSMFYAIYIPQGGMRKFLPASTRASKSRVLTPWNIVGMATGVSHGLWQKKAPDQKGRRLSCVALVCKQQGLIQGGCALDPREGRRVSPGINPVIQPGRNEATPAENCLATALVHSLYL